MIVTVGSATYAIKLRKLLSRAGIQSELIKTQEQDSTNGCVHGVRIKDSDFYEAVVILKEYGIPYKVGSG